MTCEDGQNVRVKSLNVLIYAIMVLSFLTFSKLHTSFNSVSIIKINVFLQREEHMKYLALSSQCSRVSLLIKMM